MPRKRDKRKLDTRIKRVKLKRAEAELSVYRRANEVTAEHVETDPELLRLKAAYAQTNLLYRRQFMHNTVCENLLSLEQDTERGKRLAMKVAETYGYDVIEGLSKTSIPALKPYDPDEDL